MPELKASPQNSALALVAELLKGARDAGNIVHVPAWQEEDGSPFGLGSLFLGKAPEEVMEWSYGNLPFQQGYPGIGSSIPQLKAGRSEGVIDLISAGIDLSGAKLASRLIPSGARTLPTELAPEIPSRRDFLKGLGGLGIAATMPDAVRQTMSKVDNLAPTTLVDEVAPVAARSTGGHMLAWATPEEFVSDVYNKFGMGSWAEEAMMLGNESTINKNLASLLEKANPDQAEALGRVMSSIGEDSGALSELFGFISPRELLEKASRSPSLPPEQTDLLVEKLIDYGFDPQDLDADQLGALLNRMAPGWTEWGPNEAQAMEALKHSMWTQLDGGDELLPPGMSLPSPWDADYSDQLQRIYDELGTD